MRVISRKIFNQAISLYPNDAADAAAVDKTYKALRSGSFDTPQDLKAVFPSLDNFRYVDKWWVIDIGGNNLRLIAYIDFDKQLLFAKHLGTHAEYEEYERNFHRSTCC